MFFFFFLFSAHFHAHIVKGNSACWGQKGLRRKVFLVHRSVHSFIFFLIIAHITSTHQAKTNDSLQTVFISQTKQVPVNVSLWSRQLIRRWCDYYDPSQLCLVIYNISDVERHKTKCLLTQVYKLFGLIHLELLQITNSKSKNELKGVKL